MAKIGEELKSELKNMLNRKSDNNDIISQIKNVSNTDFSNVMENTIEELFGGNSFISNKKSNISGDKKILFKYQVKSLIVMKDDERIELDHSNILSIEYMNDYEFNIMALLKVSLRIDIRRKIWILKNKKNILIKLELNKIGMDTDLEKYITSPEEVWNLELEAYFNDEDESTDIGVMESRIKLNEGKEFQSNDIEGENYFESQNTIDLYLINPNLLKASRYSFNKIYTKNTLQNFVGHMLTQSGHTNVLMSKFENDEIYSELLLPANPTYKNLIYLDQYYGLYKNGAIIYYDIDTLYILNTNGKLTVKRENEWTETTFLVSKIADSIPGNGMIRKEGEEIFYPSISDMDINPQNFAISKNAGVGSSAKIVITDTTDVELHDADQSFINERNENVAFIKDNNKFTGNVIKARMEENECVLYINGDNLDINAFTPNKLFKVVFDEPSKHELYGKYTYRLTYSYHFLKLESEGYMSSSHRIILKKTASTNGSKNSSKNNSSISGIFGNIENSITGELGRFEDRLDREVDRIKDKLSNGIDDIIDNDKSDISDKISNKMGYAIGNIVDKYKDKLKDKIKI